MAEWLRRWTRNPLGSPRTGSNPVGDVNFYSVFSPFLCKRCLYVCLFIARKTQLCRFFKLRNQSCTNKNEQTNLRGRKFFNSIFNSDILLSVYSFSCFLSVCPFVSLLKARYAEHSHIVLSCRYKKNRSFLTSCVF